MLAVFNRWPPLAPSLYPSSPPGIHWFCCSRWKWVRGEQAAAPLAVSRCRAAARTCPLIVTSLPIVQWGHQCHLGHFDFSASGKMSVAAAVLVITDWCPVEFLCLHIKSKTTLYRATKGKKDSLLALVTSLLMASGPHSWQKGHILICPHNLISHHCPLLLCYITAVVTRGNCSLSGLAINYVCDIILLKLKLNLFCGKKIVTHCKVDCTVLVIF